MSLFLIDTYVFATLGDDTTSSLTIELLPHIERSVYVGPNRVPVSVYSATLSGPVSPPTVTATLYQTAIHLEFSAPLASGSWSLSITLNFNP